MFRALLNNATNGLLVGSMAFVALSGIGYGQIRTPPTSTTPPTAGAYTQVVNCPEANGLVVDITPATLPAGWTPGHAQLELRSVEAAPAGYPAGKQALVCHYKAKDCPACTGGQDTLLLKKIVDKDACMNSIPGQPKKNFLCKPGAVP